MEATENNPEALQIHALPAKKWGRPVDLGEDLDQQVQAYICAIRSAGAVVNTAIVRAAEGLCQVPTIPSFVSLVATLHYQRSGASLS